VNYSITKKERQDITGSNCLKGVSGKVIVDEKEIKDSSTEYMEKLMNEENEWDHRILARIKEGPAGCIRINEVAAALKKMKKRHKALGLSGLVTEMIQATGDIGTRWILDLCTGIVKEGCIPEDKGKGGPMECGSCWMCYESSGKDLRIQNSAADVINDM